MKEEKGFTGIDIIISLIIITIFITVIGNLIININLNADNSKKKTIATSYAVQEIEKIKSKGYIDIYKDKGIVQEDILEENDIVDSYSKFIGYHKKISIKDYKLVQNDTTKQDNLVKEITVEISYLSSKKKKSVIISTYIARE